MTINTNITDRGLSAYVKLLTQIVGSKLECTSNLVHF